MSDLWDPLLFHVGVARTRNDCETHKKDVCLRVRQRPKSVIILLASCIPQTKVDRFSVDHNVCRVVVENGWNVLSWESICGVRNQQTSFSDGTVTDNNTFNVLHGDGI